MLTAERAASQTLDTSTLVFVTESAGALIFNFGRY